MGRPAARELTGTELEVMHAVWALGEATATEVRDELARGGRERAYTTVATLVRILVEKGFVATVNESRPFRYRATRSFEDVSRSLLGELIERVFRGSREQLLARLFEERSLTSDERALLEETLHEEGGR